MKEFTPDKLSVVYSAYSSPLSLLWHDAQVISAEGIKQGDPLGPMLFCIPHYPSSLSLEFCIFHIDDGTISGSLHDFEANLQTIAYQGQALGLQMNVDKLELISHSQATVSTILSIFSRLQFVHAHHAMLLGSLLVAWMLAWKAKFIN